MKSGDEQMNKHLGYNAEVVKLIYDLKLNGIEDNEITLLLNEFKVPKDNGKGIDFSQLKTEMLQLVKTWRKEELDNKGK